MADDGATIIIDAGSDTYKTGFVGQSSPHKIFPTILGNEKYHTLTGEEPNTYIGEEAQRKRGILSIRNPVQNGIITNFDDMETIWQHAFTNELEVVPEEHSVLLTEVSLNPKEKRERAAMIMFETFNIPSFYLAIQAVLSLYAIGLRSGTVLNSGHGITHIVPVYEGLSISHGFQRIQVTGYDLDTYLATLLLERGHSLNATADHEILQSTKEAVCFVSQDYEKTIGNPEEWKDFETTHELPDGKIIVVQSERFRIPEALFKPKLLGLEDPGIHEAIAKSISQCDIELRKLLMSNIVLSGGSTLFPGIVERLHKELDILMPPSNCYFILCFNADFSFKTNKLKSALHAKAKILAPEERKYLPWIGGSVLASLSTFQDMCISKAEYEEVGAFLVNRKFI
ncbi:13665_t:CDS:2 [Ambispora leptoticha]|uniref:Centractin n=1 Tax=Ambispora leptoticha TaxID=144679 RepID=A0A9N9BPD4_9GLOM|nr:13665_t:CDS:2 [Ambispora leptoticha]